MHFDENSENMNEIENQPEEIFDNEFLEDFIVEASEHIENIEMNILSFEKDPENEELIHSMFRSFHTIKGLAGFVEQNLIEDIAHKTETLLDCCRKKTIKADKNIANIILISSDYIKKICENITLANDKEFLAEIDIHLQKVKKAEESSKEEVSEKLPEDIPKLGEILIEENKIQLEDVNHVILKQKTEYPELKFGEVAIQEEKVKPKDVLDAIRIQQAKSPSKEAYMRISTGKVDNLVDMIGELVINQSLIEQSIMAKFGTDSLFTNSFGRMARITRDLQNLFQQPQLLAQVLE